MSGWVFLAIFVSAGAGVPVGFLIGEWLFRRHYPGSRR